MKKYSKEKEGRDIQIQGILYSAVHPNRKIKLMNEIKIMKSLRQKF